MSNSHKNCDHPATKAARARCRRQNHSMNLVTFAYNQLGWDINTLRLGEDNAQELREALTQATGLDYATRLRLEGEIENYMAPKISMSNADVQEYDRFQQRLERELDEYDQNPGQMPTPAVVTDADELQSLLDEVEKTKAEQVGREVTRENWREFKGRLVEITVEIWGAQPNSTRTGVITAWGEKYMSYRAPSGGSNNRVETTRVIKAICTK